jgi:hypothetical protein
MKTFLTQDMLASKKKFSSVLLNLSSSIPVSLPSFISQLYLIYIPSLPWVALKESWRLPPWKPQRKRLDTSVQENTQILPSNVEMRLSTSTVLLSADPRRILLELSRPGPRMRGHLNISLTGDDLETLARMIILYAG